MCSAQWGQFSKSLSVRLASTLMWLNCYMFLVRQVTAFRGLWMSVLFYSRHACIVRSKHCLFSGKHVFNVLFIFFKRRCLSFLVCQKANYTIHMSLCPCVRLEVKREDNQNCSVMCCVRQLCTLRWAVLTVLWIGFCHTGSISLCIGLFVFVCMYIAYSCKSHRSKTANIKMLFANSKHRSKLPHLYQSQASHKCKS